MKSISFIFAPRLLIPTRSIGEEREDGSVVSGIVDVEKLTVCCDLLLHGVVNANVNA